MRANIFSQGICQHASFVNSDLTIISINKGNIKFPIRLVGENSDVLVALKIETESKRKQFCYKTLVTLTNTLVNIEIKPISGQL